jgi:hypothetical protein
MMTIGLFSILAAISIPLMLSGLAIMRLNASARDVHSEMQKARLLAVSTNRPIRVRFNCPAVGQFRAVELIGTPSAPDVRDGASNRCSETLYPYPSQDQNLLTRPNHDGPVRYLRREMSFTASKTIEFWPDGTAHADAGSGNPWPPIAATGATISVTYKTTTKTITVNGIGKVSLQ